MCARLSTLVYESMKFIWSHIDMYLDPLCAVLTSVVDGQKRDFF